MKLLCAQVIKDILGDSIDYGKVGKLTADAKYEDSDIKAAIAALSFIFTSAAKHSVAGDTLDNELQQLGLPKENAGSVCKVYGDNIQKLTAALNDRSLRVSTLDSVQWRVDYVLSSSAVKDIGEPSVALQLLRKNPVTKETTPVTFTLSQEKFRLLLRDLKQAHSTMQSLAN
ncbi:COMM domain-containing protein 4 [Geodia barretti]|nr:COMM domain-containing protein 4 [Geodia barretti]